MSKIIALTLNWNGEDKLKNLYQSLINNQKALSDHNYTFEWHVKDNGSKDSSISFLEACKSESPFNIVIHDHGHNRDNFAQGMNYLFDKADPQDNDLVLFLNNDVVFNDNTSLIKMIKLHKKTNSDVVGARLLYPGTNNLQHAGVCFSTRYNSMPYHYRHGEASDEHTEKDRYFQAVTAAVMLVKADAFRKVNGLDPRFNWSFEDTDLVLRIGALKKNNVAYCGSTNISHVESASLKKNPINKLFLGPNVAYFRKVCTGKYELDYEKYLNDPKYRLVK